ncbi:MAG: radical SAM/SPASM domain-containing protein [Planctomycetota bacterium]|jgi:MoaA/NifB/PqqE/SkfB family radical SAM enzyme
MVDMRPADNKGISIRRRIAKYRLSLKYVVRLSKPLLLWRTLGNYLACIFTRRSRLRYVDLALTYKCNLNCIHCSAARLGKLDEADMSLEDYRALGRQLVRNGVLVVQLTGGEPSIRKDLDQIIRALGPKKLFISMNTNCVPLNRQRLLHLKKAGLDNLCVSVDDWDAAEHDRWRQRPGTHEKALKTIDLAREVGLRVMVFTVATHQNIRSDNFLKLVEYTRRKKVLLLVGWAVPAGNWNANEEVLLTEDDLAYLDQVQTKHLHVRTDFESNYFRWGCGAVKEKLYITATGDVIPCAFVHIKLGNIYDRPLATIRQDALKVDWFRDYNHSCLAANDREFQRRHLSKIYEADHEPITMAEAGLH